MSGLTIAILDSQYQILAWTLIFGFLFTLFIFAQFNTSFSWRVADLFWICAGGLSAISAVVLTIYLEASKEIEARLSISRADLSRLNGIARSYQDLWCPDDVDPFSLVIREVHLCLRSEAIEHRVNEHLSRNIKTFSHPFKKHTDLEKMIALLAIEMTNGSFEAYQILFADWPDQFQRLARRIYVDKEFQSSIALDAFVDGADFYLSLSEYEPQPRTVGAGDLYRRLITELHLVNKNLDQVEELWSDLNARRVGQAMRVFALAVFAFAFPLRIGKSIYELRN